LTANTRDYFTQIQRELRLGNSTEHTHRPALKQLVESVGANVIATNEPRHVLCGAPDFTITHKELTVGYIETKDVGKTLDDEEKTEQLQRYLASLHNVILTDYAEFRWYVDGVLRRTAILANLDSRGNLALRKGGEEDLSSLLGDFLSLAPTPIADSKTLSKRMARLAHLIRDVVLHSFEQGVASTELRDLRKVLSQVLIHDIDQKEKDAEFADMYAQTIVYGFFAARCNFKGTGFQRTGAARMIPKTNPFLMKLFEIITGTALDSEPYVDFVDDLVQMLANTDIVAVMEDFGAGKEQGDPVINFYESFLAEYDPEIRETRGVYYTPEPVVAYMVKSVDLLLRRDLGVSEGLGDVASTSYIRKEFLDDKGQPQQEGEPKKKLDTCHRVLVLDPACGTGTFLYAIIDLIRKDFMKKGNAGMWSGYIRNHLLPRLFGFELLMAPYSIAHFKLGMQLAGEDLPERSKMDWAYDFSGDERLGVYLTNTLEQPIEVFTNLFGPFRIIGEEASLASEVKRNLPIMVVIGNPPYSGQSANRSYDMIDGKKVPNFIGNLLKDYYQIDGKPLKERNTKWLQNDYVKFIRWGQWRIEQTGAGILALITDHGYLENPTFRGMRENLMKSFDEIYLLDLHGNSKRRERCPDGSKDENVFDIQQGVAISFFVKKKTNHGTVTIHHGDVWGTREKKYEFLRKHDVASSSWSEISPISPLNLFTPQDTKLQTEYESGWKLNEIFPLNSVGIATARDRLTVRFTHDEVWDTVNDFSKLTEEEARDRYHLGKDARDWKVGLAQQDLKSSGPKRERVVSILYRPFDVRSTYYTGKSRGFMCMPRPEVMNNMLSEKNLGLVSPKRVEIVGSWQHSFVTNTILDHVAVSMKTIDYLFPLYLYASVIGAGKHTQHLIDSLETPHARNGRIPNLNRTMLSELEKKLEMTFVEEKGDLKSTFGSEDLFHYIYAILFSPLFRSRYARLLRLESPRIQFTADKRLFGKLSALGRELVDLHLLQSTSLSKPVTKYPVPGNNEIGNGYPKFVQAGQRDSRTNTVLKENRVYVNGNQYFEGVKTEVWEYEIGAFKVCENWLKERVGRTLSFSDLTMFQKIIVAIDATMAISKRIDAAIEKWPL